MNHSSGVTIQHGLHDLEDDITRNGLCHPFIFLQVVIQLASHCGLHDHYELFALNKSMILLDDVLVL